MTAITNTESAVLTEVSLMSLPEVFSVTAAAMQWLAKNADEGVWLDVANLAERYHDLITDS